MSYQEKVQALQETIAGINANRDAVVAVARQAISDAQQAAAAEITAAEQAHEQAIETLRRRILADLEAEAGPDVDAFRDEPSHGAARRIMSAWTSAAARMQSETGRPLPSARLACVFAASRVRDTAGAAGPMAHAIVHIDAEAMGLGGVERAIGAQSVAAFRDALVLLDEALAAHERRGGRSSDPDRWPHVLSDDRAALARVDASDREKEREASAESARQRAAIERGEDAGLGGELLKIARAALGVSKLDGAPG